MTFINPHIEILDGKSGLFANLTGSLDNLTGAALKTKTAHQEPTQQQEGAGNSLLGLIGGALAGLASVAGGMNVSGGSHFELNPGTLGDMSRSVGMSGPNC